MFFAAKDGKFYTVRKKRKGEKKKKRRRPRADCDSDYEMLIVKFRLKLKKVGKTTRSFTCDLNEILYNYTVEVMNRFKELDLVDRMPVNFGWRFITLYRRQ